ncbi:MAG: peptide chain release factor N(5)-glutamine methyltransferase [Candidatus Saccharimonadales bacterium]
MNVNLLPQTPVIKEWLQHAAGILDSIGITSARLDAEIILAHSLRKPRTYLHAHGEDTLQAREYEVAEARLQLRIDRVPIAYIIGHKDFYGRQFQVTTATLIPRPESEVMIELLGEIITRSTQHTYKTVVDVGTGSGCLGITVKLEHPELSVTLLDISNYALQIARLNATKLKAQVDIIRSDLLKQYVLPSDIILANLPYVDTSWDVSPETRHEPSLALFADKNGRGLIEKLIVQAATEQPLHGLLLLEADPWQHSAIIEFAMSYRYHHIESRDYIIALTKD